MPNFDIASFNLINWANATPDLYDSIPKNVEIVQKDENGNLFTKTIANRGMFKQQLWNDVGGALGQFSRIFYVDQENGDDNNTGTSDSPFKTLQKAVYATPVSGSVDVMIKGDYYLKASSDRVNISGGRKVRIYGAETGDEKLTLEYDTQVCFALYVKSMLTISMDVDLKQTVDDGTIKNIISNDDESIYQIYANRRKSIISGTTEYAKVTFLSDYVGNIYNRRSTVSYMYCDIDTGGFSNINLMQVGFTSRLNIAFGSIDGDSFDATNVKPLVSGIVFDADSGNPINLLCNLNLSN